MIKQTFALLLFILILADWAMALPNLPVLKQQTAVSANLRGVVLLIHGLNNNSKIFDAISKELLASGFHITTFQLSGHSGVSADKHRATASKWLNEVKQALTATQSLYPGLPLYAIGYSLGGLALVLAVNENDTVRPKALVLLAPALEVPFYANAVRAFFPVSFFDFSLPSAAPAQYLAYTSTSVRSYQALFELIDLAKVLPAHLSLPPSLVVSHVFDPLVDHAGLKDFISEHELTNWQLYERRDELQNYSFSYHHIFAKEAFSEGAWNSQIKAILRFLISDKLE